MTTEVKSTDSNNPELKQKKKFKLKMPSALAIIVGVVLFVTMLTWIPHAAGKAESVNGWDAGSLAAWQNYIFMTNMGITGDAIYQAHPGLDSALADDVISKFGLDGYYDADLGYFITDTWVTFPLGAYADGSSSMFGIFDSFKAMLGGYQDAFGVAFYIVGIYALVLLLMESETLKDGVSSLVRGLGGKEILLVPILFVLFSAGGTLFGMQEETLGLLPIIVPVFILAGFDAPVGMLVAVLGTTTGIAASVLDPFSVAVFAEGLGTTVGTAVAERTILFVIYTTIGALFVTWYALRVLKNQDKSLDKDNLESNKVWAKEHIGDITELETMNKKQKWALGIFGFVFAWMIFALMPWTTWFPALNDSPFWLFFSGAFYNGVLIGEWYFIELGILFFVAAIIIGKIFGKSMSSIFATFWQSLKEMFGVITIIAFSRATAIILATSGLTYGMIYGTIKDTGSLGSHPITFTLMWLLIFTMMAFFIPSTSGLAGVTAPIAGGFVEAASEEHKSLMMVGLLMAYPLAQGVVNMFSPTTGLVVVQAEQSKVNYGKVLPWLAGYAATIFVVGMVMITVILGIEVAIA